MPLKPTTMMHLATAMEDMDKYNAWDFEYKAKEVLGRLGIHDTENLYGTLIRWSAKSALHWPKSYWKIRNY